MAAAGSGDLWFDSGRLCLDLAATAAARAAGGPVERLGTPQRLRAWLTGTGLVPPGTPLTAADHDWPARFRTLRDLLHRLVRAELGGHRVGTDLDALNAFAAPAPPAVRAVPGRDGALVRVAAAEPDCTALLSVVARDAVDLLTDPVARGQLRECEGDSCSLVYLDTSRGRRRRWCSSGVCGNRERVARHRRRAVARRS